MNVEFGMEFQKIKELWKQAAQTSAAKRQIEDITYLLDERELRKALKDTTDARELLEQCGTPPLSSLDEVEAIIGLAQKEGCLTPYQLERVEKVLVLVSRLKEYLRRGMQLENSLAYYEVNLDDLGELREEIAQQIRGGEVDDYASKQLQQLRKNKVHLEERMKQKADQILRSSKSYLSDSFSTVRNGHICLPVKSVYKHKVAGTVIDQSASGSTVFMEPKGVGELYEELQLLQIEEENEVRRILYVLTGMVADHGMVLEENRKLIEKLDYIFSKGKLSQEMQAVPPRMNVERRICLKNARHPLMEREQAVPLQFEIGGKVQGIVITGPNTGGKTVSIKTVALNCLMAQCGLHVACEDAEICMNSAFLCDIGDGQDITENLSTFSAHIKNVLEILERVDSDSLVIMDELGSGTDPTEGMGIAIAILEELRKSGCLYLVTTHYPEVKDYALKAQGVLNARMEFDRETLRPTYRMIIGEAGESCAFYIAEKLGMPESMLWTARTAAYGEEKKDRKADQKWELKEDAKEEQIGRKPSKIRQIKEQSRSDLTEKYQIGDSVMVLPDHKIGIVCRRVNDKGVLQVQLPEKKIWINHKRVKIHIHADQLYPEDYDFSIIFDTVEERKIRHDMERKYTEETIHYEKEIE